MYNVSAETHQGVAFCLYTRHVIDAERALSAAFSMNGQHETGAQSQRPPVHM